MTWRIIITIATVIFFTWLNYRGAIGRIERRNTFNDRSMENLGEISDEELIAFAEDKHHILALKQAIIPGLIFGLIAWLIGSLF